MGIDYKEDYAVLTDGERKSFVLKYNAEDMSKGNYRKVFMNCLIESRLSYCTNYTQYGDIFIKYADRPEINLDKYNKLSAENKSKVMNLMYTDKNFDADTIVTAFNTAVERYSAVTPTSPSGKNIYYTENKELLNHFDGRDFESFAEYQKETATEDTKVDIKALLHKSLGRV